MEYRELGKTGLRVSPVCLGTAQFGTGLLRELALWQLDAFTAGGGNFIDTAHVYGDWVPGERARSERIIGEWLRKSGKRDQVVIMTKGAHPLLETMEVSRCTPEGISTDIDGSLRALGVDHIDLYLLHRDNPPLPAAVLLEALEKARQQGKIRHYGFSNWTLPRVREAEAQARKAGIEGFTCNQIMWSLAETNVENVADKSMVLMDRDTYAWHSAGGTALTSYHSTAHGWFVKQEQGQEAPEKLRRLYDNGTNEKISALIKQAAGESGLSALDISLGYLMAHPFPSVPVTAFSRKEQLEEALAAMHKTLPPDLVAQLNHLKGLG